MTRKKVALLSPCSARGIAFESRPEGRFCPSCGETVHDLSQATRREAVALIQSQGGTLCGRVRRRADGTVRFRPEPPDRGSLGSAVRTAAVALSLAACGSDGPNPRLEPEPAPTATATEPTPGLPAEVTPTEVTPAEVTPTEVTPAEVTPAEATPAEVTPAEVTPTNEQVEDPTTYESTDRAQHRRHRRNHAPVRMNDEELIDGGLGFVEL